MIPVNLTTPPTLIAPEHNALKPGTLTLNFSWQPVSGATKYLLCTNGRANIPTEAMRIMEVQGQTSAEITYSPFTPYAPKYIYWFVVAGNHKGWSLPSEIRKVYFSMDSYIASGKVLDENEMPVPEVSIRGEGETFFSDDNGNYELITRDYCNTGIVFSLRKKGYSDCYTFYRQTESFDTFGDLTIISKTGKDAIYNGCGEISDTTKGTIAGIVVNKNDQVLAGAEVFIEPTSGNIYYLDVNNLPDFSLSSTGSSGKFVILNVAPGGYRISANRNGYTSSYTDLWGKTQIGPGVIVFENSITVDAIALPVPIVDNCPNDPNKTEPGICGCGVADTDSDGDGTPDCNDDDDDNDGMPDEWEEQYDLNPLVNDASDDPDNDGYSNYKEYQAGTNPNNPNSFPKTKAMPWIPLLLLDEL